MALYLYIWIIAKSLMKRSTKLISLNNSKSIKELELIYNFDSITNKITTDQIDYLRNELIETSSRKKIKNNLSMKK